jgi:hypothetical protein
VNERIPLPRHIEPAPPQPRFRLEEFMRAEHWCGKAEWRKALYRKTQRSKTQ